MSKRENLYATTDYTRCFLSVFTTIFSLVSLTVAERSLGWFVATDLFAGMVAGITLIGTFIGKRYAGTLR